MSFFLKPDFELFPHYLTDHVYTLEQRYGIIDATTNIINSWLSPFIEGMEGTSDIRGV